MVINVYFAYISKLFSSVFLWNYLADKLYVYNISEDLNISSLLTDISGNRSKLLNVYIPSTPNKYLSQCTKISAVSVKFNLNMNIKL
jgi:hypothetical protein